MPRRGPLPGTTPDLKQTVDASLSPRRTCAFRTKHFLVTHERHLVGLDIRDGSRLVWGPLEPLVVPRHEGSEG